MESHTTKGEERGRAKEGRGTRHQLTKETHYVMSLDVRRKAGPKPTRQGRDATEREHLWGGSQGGEGGERKRQGKPREASSSGCL